MGTTLILLGLSIVVLGVILSYAPFLLTWFGSLPGDINYRRENARIFVPITSMILVSVIITVITKILGRFR